MHPMMGQPAINGSLVPGQPSKVGGVPINGESILTRDPVSH
jgi:hypothetical protein